MSVTIQFISIIKQAKTMRHISKILTIKVLSTVSGYSHFLLFSKVSPDELKTRSDVASCRPANNFEGVGVDFKMLGRFS